MPRAKPSSFLSLSIWSALAGFGLLVAAPLHADNKDAIRSTLNQVKAERQKGDYNDARVTLLKALDASPQNVELRLMLARTYIDLEDGVSAEVALKKALSQGAEDRQIRLLMARALLLQGKHKDALDWLTGGNIPRQQFAEAAHLKGRIHFAMGDTDLAGQAYDMALDNGLSSSELWTDIARFRFASANLDGAIGALDRALQINPDDFIALKFRAELMRGQYGLVSALPWFERAIAIAPNDLPLLAEYAATLGDMGRNREMLEVTRKILARNPKYARAWFMQAVMAARAGKFELAQLLMQHAGDDMNTVPAAMLLNGVIAYQRDNYTVAISWLEKLVAMQPHNQRARKLLARSYYAAGDYQSLLERFHYEVNQPQAHSYMLTLYARALEASDQPEQALNYRERAANPILVPLSVLDQQDDPAILASEAAKNPNSARSNIPWIRKLVATGQLDRALPIALRLQNENPGVPDAHLIVGDIHFIAGRYQPALQAYQRAAQIKMTSALLRRMNAVLRLLNRGQDADKLLVGFVSYNPSSTTGLKLLADSYVDHQNWTAASRLFKELTRRLGPWQPALMADYAYATLHDGQVDDAVQAARIAHRIQPGWYVASHVYGKVLTDKARQSKDKRYGKAAVNMLQKAQKLQPGNPWLNYRLAQAYLLYGQKNRARKTLQLSLRQGPFPERNQALQLAKSLTSESRP